MPALLAVISNKTYFHNYSSICALPTCLIFFGKKIHFLVSNSYIALGHTMATKQVQENVFSTIPCIPLLCACFPQTFLTELDLSQGLRDNLPPDSGIVFSKTFLSLNPCHCGKVT